jgi:hypothetical protein
VHKNKDLKIFILKNRNKSHYLENTHIIKGMKTISHQIKNYKEIIQTTYNLQKHQVALIP